MVDLKTHSHCKRREIQLFLILKFHVLIPFVSLFAWPARIYEIIFVLIFFAFIDHSA